MDREDGAMNEVVSVQALESKTDFIPYESYISPAFAKGEKERLWPAVWLVAAREEEFSEPGKFVTFDIADESILLTRDTTGQIRAFFNVCPHRGRRITKGCGLAAKFYCNYHGRQWNLDGTNKVMIDSGDWTGISPADVALRPVRVDTWGGFVVVNIDGQAEPLLDYLHPWPEMWENYRIQDMRYRWFKTTKLNCNWKVALEAFLEGYHAQTTHPRPAGLTAGNARPSAAIRCSTMPTRHHGAGPTPTSRSFPALAPRRLTVSAGWSGSIAI